MKRIAIPFLILAFLGSLAWYLFQIQPPAPPAIATPLLVNLPVEWTVKQRSTTSVPGSDDRLLLTIGDITRGQVIASLATSSGATVLAPRSIEENNSAKFSYGKKSYQLLLEQLRNQLIGEDSAIFKVTDSAAKSVSEKEKIEMLIREVEALPSAMFIRNGVEHSAHEAAEHLRSKWKWAGDSIQSAEQFIEQLGTKSSQTGEPYEIRFSDGDLVPAAKFLRDRLKEINAPQDTP